MTEKDVIIIGGGPAGASAALYAARGGLDVCVVHDGTSALEKAVRIQNFYGAGEIGGRELYLRGIEQARSVGADIVDGQATFARYDGTGFVVGVSTVDGETEYSAKRLVVATGSRRAMPNIDGLKEFDGKGVSSCAVCDAFFYRGKRVAVVGSGEYAKHEYDALHIAGKRYLLTDGEEPSFAAADTVTKKIARVFGGDGGRIAGVEFDDGEKLEIDGLFVALGTLGAGGLAKQLGILTDKTGAIVTDADGMTNISGLYAAGDCTAGIKQVARAVVEGMNVGLAIVRAAKSGGVNNG